ncbi:GRB2-associated-binding protein 1 [Macrosteles quadrilineatus]|uniref:GRB2-associated-binding protein 1 n=1 Tax=Macrosteles quadrilineatus TaxID=74068 RepID=UPI0023E245B7|nr:GRB2-associated-binding protein 1 [Macrosteles quadrilineatus]
MVFVTERTFSESKKMSAQSDSLEIVHEGWLTKSPPTKSIWRARWRKRWFVLRHSGELPGQYFLCYYTDKNCRKLKGRIDLDQCEQVDAGLRFENHKQKYQHMFDVKTPKRTYYLAAETEEEMNKWVDCVCQVCGLKAYSQYEVTPFGSEETPSLVGGEESPPVSPASTASGPYIPISECISGPPLSSPDSISNFLILQRRSETYDARRSETYDAPRKLQPPQLELRGSGSTTPPLQSPATDGESVFTDGEEWPHPHPKKPPVNWETFPRPSDSSADGDTPKPSSMVTVGKRFTRNLEDAEIPIAPPRPPKPSHLNNSHSYSNIEDLSVSPSASGVTDETYDFPRSHQINGGDSYTNAAPGKVNGDVFRYDFAATARLSETNGEPTSPPHSDSSSVVLYSNLPSPAPPVVNRGLKPRRRDSTSNEPSPLAPPVQPPTINRKLKPVPARRRIDDECDGNVLKLCPPPLGRLVDGSQSLRRPRAAPSPTPNKPHRRNSDTFNDQVYYFEPYYGLSRKMEIQYLDLALDSNSSGALPATPSGSPSTPTGAPPTPIIYKKVDFLKTLAFNSTRVEREQERMSKPIH